ncbi:MAG: transcriptional repressor LexA [Clostridia bacterium]|nr:transcriptional repressor LexA [Clostridia bacterium]
MSKIDAKLDELYLYIINYKKETGISPTVRDICKDLSIKSTATAKYYIDKLIERGLIDKQDDKKRALTVKNNFSSESLTVPLIGTITAGSPIFAVENLEGYYQIPSEYSTDSDLFMLRVKGDSMINVGILNGDKIIVKKSDTCLNGDIVVALLDDSATVKRFVLKDGVPTLHPENDAYNDIVGSFKILGIVRGLMRKF